MLAHQAKDEGGDMVGDMIAGKYGHMNYNTIPSVIYTAPGDHALFRTNGRAGQGEWPSVRTRSASSRFAASGRARAIGIHHPPQSNS